MDDSGAANSRAHWEAVYTSTSPVAVSWYEHVPTRSLALLEQVGAGPSTAIIDVGGGASTLADALLDRGVGSITVLDISGTALEAAKTRLGPRAKSVVWIEADFTRADLGVGAYDVWHDRAVFHFLTDGADRRRYAAAASRALRPGGVALIGVFSPHGPARCSGLDVVRYDAGQLARELGDDFSLEQSVEDVHHTPAGTVQSFTFAVLRRR